MSRYRLRPHRLGAKTKKPPGPTREELQRQMVAIAKHRDHILNHLLNFTAWAHVNTTDDTLRGQLPHLMTNIGVNATPDELAKKAGLKPQPRSPGIVLASGGILVPGRP